MSIDSTTDRAAQVMAQLGRALRELRKDQDLTIQKLADSSGVSRRVISQMERGDANPSLATIDRVARALGTNFTQLMTPPRQESLIVSSAEEASVTWSSPRGSSATLLQVTPGATSAEISEWRIVPRDNYTAQPAPAGSFDLYTVVEGALTIEVEHEAAKTIRTGGSGRLASDRSYTFRNNGRGTVHFFKVTQFSGS